MNKKIIAEHLKKDLYPEYTENLQNSIIEKKTIKSRGKSWTDTSQNIGITSTWKDVHLSFGKIKIKMSYHNTPIIKLLEVFFKN